MDKYKCTIEEREEYFRHIEDGNLLFAGVDYPMILHEAEKEADVIIWDGGNNDLPFYKPDLHITLVDSLRATDEEHYFPGETNVRMADVVLVSKVNSLDSMEKAVEHAEHLKTIVKPHTPVFFGKSVVSAEGDREEAEALVKGKRVLVVDDGRKCPFSHLLRPLYPNFSNSIHSFSHFDTWRHGLWSRFCFGERPRSSRNC